MGAPTTRTVVIAVALLAFAVLSYTEGAYVEDEGDHYEETRAFTQPVNWAHIFITGRSCGTRRYQQGDVYVEGAGEDAEARDYTPAEVRRLNARNRKCIQDAERENRAHTPEFYTAPVANMSKRNSVGGRPNCCHRLDTNRCVRGTCNAAG